MSLFQVPFAKQELLHYMLREGGTAVCTLHSPARMIQATFSVELTDSQARVAVEMGSTSNSLTLRRTDPANHLHLRDFLEDIANGRIESAIPAPPASVDAAADSALSIEDRMTLSVVAGNGGAVRLSTGHIVSVHCDGQHRTGILAYGSATHLVSGSAADLFASMSDQVALQLAA